LPAIKYAKRARRLSIGVFHLVTRSDDVMAATTIEGFFAPLAENVNLSLVPQTPQHRPNSEESWAA
jgi:hypothetical protein